MPIFDMTAATTQYEIGAVFDMTAATTQYEVGTVFDMTAAGVTSEVFSSRPATITVSDMLNWSFPAASGGYAAADGAVSTWGFSGHSAYEQKNDNYGLGYRVWDYTYLGQGYEVGWVRWAVNIVAGRVYYYSAIGTGGAGHPLKLSGGGINISATSRIASSGILRPSSNSSSITFTTSGANAAPYLNALDIVDVTELVKYVSDATAKSLCDTYCRAVGVWGAINIPI